MTNYLLDSEELTWVTSKNLAKNRLVAAVMLKFFQAEGRYPENDDPISLELVTSLAKQIDIDVKEFDITEQQWNNRSIERFRQEIRQLLNYRRATVSDGQQLVKHLMQDHDILTMTDAKQLEKAYEFFKLHKLEPLKTSEIRKYITTAITQIEADIFAKITNSLSIETKESLYALLKDKENKEETIEDKEKKAKLSKRPEMQLWQLKKDLTGSKLKDAQAGIDKLNSLRKIALLPVLADYNRKLAHKYYLRVMALVPSNIEEYIPQTRYTLMTFFCYIRSQILTDSLADLLLRLIKKMRNSAETVVSKEILSDVKCINGKFDILHSLAFITANNPNCLIKKKVYPEVSQITLNSLVTELRSKGRWYQNKVQGKIKSLYSQGARSTLLTLLDVFDFESHDQDSKKLVSAIKFIKNNRNFADQFYPDADKVPIEGVFSTEWYDAVISSKGINRFNYEVAVLEELHNRLSCKLIWIKGAYRYRDPDEDLPKDFEERKEYYYGLLGLPLCPKEFTSGLQNRVSMHLIDLHNTISANTKVKILDTKGGRIKITPSEPQEEPTNIKLLQQAINQRFSTINLIDILKEVDLMLNFTKKFQTAGFHSAMEQEKLRKRALLCIYALGSNAGLKRISTANENINYEDLRYIKRKYINTSNIKEAIADVINQINDVRDPEIWGIATTGVACDSTQVSAWDQNLLTEWHPRYKEYGVMIYWHVDMKSTCIYSQLKSCTSSEVGSMLKGILNHCTKMDIKQSYVDTHGQSLLGFGFSNLFKFDLLPRLKRINRQKLYYWSGKDKSKYSNIEPILEAPIDKKAIEENYHQAVKHAVALKIGSVEPEVMVKHLSSYNDNHPAYKALIEIGKAAKTIFLCRYLSSESLRIEIHAALNVVERLNSIMHFIFYGKLGELTSNNTEEQALSVACLHLLQVCMVYINTLIIQQVLAEEFWKNRLTSQDKRALTPLLHAHINPYGLFPLDLDQRLIILTKRHHG
jgi:TnpA family transposase